MLRFEKNTEDRKTLAVRLGELTGIRPHYTAAPRMAYEVGDWTIERDGTLTVGEDKANEEILHTLEVEGLILPVRNEEPAAEKVEVALPLEGHTGISLRNFVNLIYQRGSLVSKATGGHFHVDIDLVNALRGTEDLTLDKALEILSDHSDDLTGIKVTEDKIIFTGLPEFAEPDTLQAFLDLAFHMNRQALKQKRIYPKDIDDGSEKFAFHVWLTPLGMNGSEFKKTRKILMKNLTGYAAFPNETEAKKFYERQEAKRKAQKEQAQD